MGSVESHCGSGHFIVSLAKLCFYDIQFAHGGMNNS